MDIHFLIKWYCLLMNVCVQGAQKHSACKTGWLHLGGSCYYFVKYPRSDFLDALTYCVDLDGYLAEVTSKEENELLKEQCRSDLDYAYWIGGFQNNELQWFWLNGSPWNFTDWHTGERKSGDTQSCLLMNGQFNYRWDDAHYSRSERFICEVTLAEEPKSPSLGKTTTESSSDARDTYSTIEVSIVPEMCGALPKKNFSYCDSHCSKTESPEDIELAITALQTRLTIHKSQTAKYMRTLISAADDRASAAGIGWCGVLVLVSIIVLVITVDVLNCLGYMQGPKKKKKNNVKAKFRS